MQTLIIYMHQPNCSNVEMSLTISALAETVLADSSRPLQMASVLVINVLVADDGLQLSWKEQTACESRRQLLADSPSSSRSCDPLGVVDDTPSTLHLLDRRESW